MKKLLPFISAANQFIIFIVALFVVLKLGGELVNNVLRTDGDGPKVQVNNVQNGDPATENIIRDVQFRSTTKGVLVFDILTNVVDMGDNNTKMKMGYFSGSDEPRLHRVNMLFVPPEGPSYRLMKNDVYIKRTSLYDNSNKEHSTNISKNIYWLIPKDSNGDGFLSGNDDAELYVSDYDGKNMLRILSGVNDYKLISDDMLIIESFNESAKVFHSYNVASGRLSRIKVNEK